MVLNIKHCLTNIKRGILSTLLLLIFIIFMFLLMPVFLYRYCVIILQKKYRKDLYQIISGLSLSFAVFDEELELSTSSNLTLSLRMESWDTSSFEQFEKKFIDVILDTKPNSSEFVYPTFQTYPITWLGFTFWKWESNFNMDDHIQSVKIKDGMSAFEVEKNILGIPFRNDKSPWGITFLEHDEKGCITYYVIFKVHHVLTDGFGLNDMFLRLSDNSTITDTSFPEIRNRKDKNQNLLQNIRNYIAYPFRASNDIVTVYSTMSADRTIENILPMMENIQPRMHCITKEYTSFQKIKEISALHEVSCTAVQLAVVSKGIHDYFLRSNKSAPEFTSAMFPVPVPRRLSGSNNGNGNHFSTALLNLPIGIGDLEDDHKRLQMCQTAYLQAMNPNKVFPHVYYFLLSTTHGSIPNCLLRLPFGPLTTWPTVILDSFPGPRSIQTINGHAVLGVHFNFQGGQGQCDHKGIGLCLMVYNRQFQWVVDASPTTFPTETLLQEFVDKLPMIFETMQSELLSTKYLPSEATNGNDTRLHQTERTATLLVA